MTFKKELDPHGREANHFQIFITPVENSLPRAKTGEYRSPAASIWTTCPNGNIRYFTPNRDGYSCFWAQRLNPKTKYLQGPPLQSSIVTTTSPPNFHNAFTTKLNVAASKIVTNIQQFHSDIWLTQLPPGE